MQISLQVKLKQSRKPIGRLLYESHYTTNNSNGYGQGLERSREDVVCITSTHECQRAHPRTGHPAMSLRRVGGEENAR
ncbi:hypothetical protein J6590_001152 [Homalodisca vitripennis]|nr:hypothetical protein J6590_001152 [Homalodisca vitripennis]